MPEFKLRHQQFKNGKTKLVSKLVLLLFSNKRVAFFGIPGSILPISAFQDLP